MKRVNYKLNKNEECITIMFALKKNAKKKKISIIHSENLEIIDEIIFN